VKNGKCQIQGKFLADLLRAKSKKRRDIIFAQLKQESKEVDQAKETRAPYPNEWKTQVLDLKEQVKQLKFKLKTKVTRPVLAARVKPPAKNPGSVAVELEPDPVITKSESKFIKKVLKNQPPEYKLKSMSDLFEDNSFPSFKDQTYEPIGYPFCDGIGYCLGPVDSRYVKDCLSQLKIELAEAVPDVKVQNLLVSRRNNLTYLWVTLA